MTERYSHPHDATQPTGHRHVAPKPRSPALPRDRAEGGFTVLELVIGLAIMSSLVVPVVMVTLSANRMTVAMNVMSRVLEQNRIASYRLADDFKNAIAGSAVVAGGGTILSFTRHGGFDGTATIPGDLLRYEFQPSPDDAVNGTDDDGDGIVDEGVLVRFNDTTLEVQTLASSLDMTSCTFTPSGNGAVVTLSTIGRGGAAPTSTRMSRTLVLTPMN